MVAKEMSISPSKIARSWNNMNEHREHYPHEVQTALELHHMHNRCYLCAIYRKLPNLNDSVAELKKKLQNGQCQKREILQHTGTRTFSWDRCREKIRMKVSFTHYSSCNKPLLTIHEKASFTCLSLGRPAPWHALSSKTALNSSLTHLTARIWYPRPHVAVHWQNRSTHQMPLFKGCIYFNTVNILSDLVICPLHQIPHKISKCNPYISFHLI